MYLGMGGFAARVGLQITESNQWEVVGATCLKEACLLAASVGGAGGGLVTHCLCLRKLLFVCSIQSQSVLPQNFYK